MLDGLVLVTAPAADTLDLAATKTFLKVEVTDDDDLIRDLIRGVVQAVEAQTGLGLLTQTWDLSLETFPAWTQKNPGAAIELPRWPVQSVTSIAYADSAGAPQTLASAAYVLNASPAKRARILPALGTTWPTTQALPGGANVTVRFKAGYGDEAGTIPADLLREMWSAVAELYERREQRVTGTIAELRGMQAILDRYNRLPMGIA